MVYYCKINNGISKIMDTTINGTTLNENALKNRSTDVCTVCHCDFLQE